MTGWRKYLWYRLGFRGLFLVLLGVQDIAFGFFLYGSTRPEYLRFLVDVNRIWYLLWIGTGLFLFTGALQHPPLVRQHPEPASGRYDRVQYAAAVALKTGFAVEYIRLAFTGDFDDWGIGVYWLMQMCMVLAAAAWPER